MSGLNIDTGDWDSESLEFGSFADCLGDKYLHLIPGRRNKFPWETCTNQDLLYTEVWTGLENQSLLFQDLLYVTSFVLLIFSQFLEAAIS